MSRAQLAVLIMIGAVALVFLVMEEDRMQPAILVEAETASTSAAAKVSTLKQNIVACKSFAILLANQPTTRTLLPHSTASEPQGAVCMSPHRVVQELLSGLAKRPHSYNVIGEYGRLMGLLKGLAAKNKCTGTTQLLQSMDVAIKTGAGIVASNEKEVHLNVLHPSLKPLAAKLIIKVPAFQQMVSEVQKRNEASALLASGSTGTPSGEPSWKGRPAQAAAAKAQKIIADAKVAAHKLLIAAVRKANSLLVLARKSDAEEATAAPAPQSQQTQITPVPEPTPADAVVPPPSAVAKKPAAAKQLAAATGSSLARATAEVAAIEKQVGEDKHKVQWLEHTELSLKHLAHAPSQPQPPAAVDQAPEAPAAVAPAAAAQVAPMTKSASDDAASKAKSSQPAGSAPGTTVKSADASNGGKVRKQGGKEADKNFPMWDDKPPARERPAVKAAKASAAKASAEKASAAAASPKEAAGVPVKEAQHQSTPATEQFTALVRRQYNQMRRAALKEAAAAKLRKDQPAPGVAETTTPASASVSPASEQDKAAQEERKRLEALVGFDQEQEEDDMPPPAAVEPPQQAPKAAAPEARRVQPDARATKIMASLITGSQSRGQPKAEPVPDSKEAATLRKSSRLQKRLQQPEIDVEAYPHIDDFSFEDKNIKELQAVVAKPGDKKVITFDDTGFMHKVNQQPEEPEEEAATSRRTKILETEDWDGEDRVPLLTPSEKSDLEKRLHPFMKEHAHPEKADHSLLDHEMEKVDQYELNMQLADIDSALQQNPRGHKGTRKLRNLYSAGR